VHHLRSQRFGLAIIPGLSRAARAVYHPPTRPPAAIAGFNAKNR